MDVIIGRWPGVRWLRLWVTRDGITFHGQRYRGLIVQHSVKIGPLGVGVAWLRTAERLRKASPTGDPAGDPTGADDGP